MSGETVSEIVALLSVLNRGKKTNEQLVHLYGTRVLKHIKPEPRKKNE